MYTKNENQLRRVTELFPEIAREVDVQGYILDKMISHKVISFELREEIDKVATQENHARRLLKHILTSSNLQAASFFIEALEFNYKDLAHKLTGQLRESSLEGEGDIVSSSLLTYNYYHFA